MKNVDMTRISIGGGGSIIDGARVLRLPKF